VSGTRADGREAFAHQAVLEVSPDEDEREPGAAITIELCGSTDHDPPCPFAPHYVEAHRAGDGLHIRILFAVVPERETEVRDRIESALKARWQVRSAHATPVRPDETEHAGRLALS
jgi:hypothetical protein